MMNKPQAGTPAHWPVVVESVSLLSTYVTGTILAALVQAPLALAYVALVLVSNLLFMALICPYCILCQTRSCHSHYHLIARFFRQRPGKTFAIQLKRYLAVVFPVWFVPLLAGGYGLWAGRGWPVAAVLVLFFVSGFVILPFASRHFCPGCPNASQCPRGRSRGTSPR